MSYDGSNDPAHLTTGKIGIKPPYLFARPEDIDVLITDHPPEKSLQQSLQKNHKKLIVPKN